MGFIFNALMKFSSPTERFNAAIKNKTPTMTETFPFGVITYYRGFDDHHMIRLQISESTPEYIKIIATSISVDEHKKNAEALAYGAIQDRYIKESLIGIVSTVEEINLFLKDVWNKFGWKPNPGIGSKWQRMAKNGFWLQKTIRWKDFFKKSLSKRCNGIFYLSRQR